MANNRTQKTYFIQQGLDGPIKIGKSQNPLWRLSELQSGNPVKLHLLKAVEEDWEAVFHEKFAHLQIRGEWFAPDAELIEFIGGEEWCADVLIQHSDVVEVRNLGMIFGFSSRGLRQRALWHGIDFDSMVYGDGELIDGHNVILLITELGTDGKKVYRNHQMA